MRRKPDPRLGSGFLAALSLLLGEALKADFEAEGNRFLYKARAAENRHFRDYALRQVIARYLYLVDGSGAAYHGSP